MEPALKWGLIIAAVIFIVIPVVLGLMGLMGIKIFSNMFGNLFGNVSDKIPSPSQLRPRRQ